MSGAPTAVTAEVAVGAAPPATLAPADMSRWFPRPHAPSPSAAVRLICFAHAGGGASGFFRWGQHLPAGIEVVACHLPGHEERLREPAVERMGPLLDALIPELLPLLDRPVAFFGHSLGAWIAFGAARRLRDAAAPLPLRLFVSSSRAPHLPSRLAPLHQLAAPALLHELQRRYGRFPSVILEDRDSLEMYLAVLRADFALFETTAFGAEPPLSCPITLFGGRGDEVVTAADLEAWAIHSTTPTAPPRLFDGGHHYLKDLPRDLFAALAGALPGIAAPHAVR
jgi:medium-chain acyl-[acyl-carrier-protein] hydrolase